jgi:hypothetical protein
VVVTDTEPLFEIQSSPDFSRVFVVISKKNPARTKSFTHATFQFAKAGSKLLPMKVFESKDQALTILPVVSTTLLLDASNQVIDAWPDR